MTDPYYFVKVLHSNYHNKGFDKFPFCSRPDWLLINFMNGRIRLSNENIQNLAKTSLVVWEIYNDISDFSKAYPGDYIVIDDKNNLRIITVEDLKIYKSIDLYGALQDHHDMI